ncbi:MAG: alpha/beta hydrolase [Alicyclobacillaceae bacterium]|nr:alpha/beta hydrolase [Alicyclobacillaceae bacterium]
MRFTKSVAVSQTRVLLTTNITYAQVGHPMKPVINVPLHMSVLRPDVPDHPPLPVLVWLQGGAWMVVDKDMSIPWLAEFARRGYVVASVQYRTSGEAKFPAQIEDVKAAIRYLRAHADVYNIDPDRIAIMGESAGGHLAALAGTTSGLTTFDKGDWLEYSSAVQLVIDFYGPTDIAQMSKFPCAFDHDAPYSPESLLIGAVVGEDREKAAAVNPIRYISRGCPPFLIIHGDKDDIVPLNQSELLYDALVRNGVEATFYVLSGAGHATAEFWQPEVQALVLEFLNAHLEQRP